MIEAYKKAYNFCEIDEQATCKSMIFSLKTIWQLWARFGSNISTAQKSTLFSILYWIIEPYIDLYINQSPQNVVKMATESTATIKIILSKAEDWEKWFRQLKAHVDSDIWAYLDPDVDEEDEEELMKKPVKPILRDYNHNTMIFANLSQAQ